MFIGHAPAGYLASVALARVADRQDVATQKCVIALGTVCSVLPDLDLAYFYLIDQRQHPHHAYWTHMPLFWIALWALSWPLWRARPARRVLAGTALLGLMLHMVLDSIAAEILWAYPWSERSVNLVHVEARYDWWVMNFLLHWTFGIELLVVAAGAWVFWRRRARRRGRGAPATD